MSPRKDRSPPRLCKAAVDLRDYLNLEFDAHDFTERGILEEWNEHFPELAVDPEEFEPPKDTEKFRAWVEKHVIPEYMGWTASERHDPTSLPAYIHFDGAKLLPKGSWLIHFSENRFTRFDRGTTLENLALATWNRKKSMVDCKSNLRSGAIFEMVWGFAFDVDDRNASTGFAARNYGSRVLLFRTDCAVMAWHTGDQQYQAIFPLCSEYNTHSGSYSSGTWYFEGKNGEDLDFDDLDDAIEAAEKGKLA